MALEAAQLLQNCFSLEVLAAPDCPRTKNNTPRKHCYAHHPCAKWVKQSRENMRWLLTHAFVIDDERVARNGTAPHFCIPFLQWVANRVDLSLAPEAPLTPFAQAMPDDCKNEDAVVAYRDYYRRYKTHLHSWKRNRPPWIENC